MLPLPVSAQRNGLAQRAARANKNAPAIVAEAFVILVGAVGLIYLAVLCAVPACVFRQQPRHPYIRAEDDHEAVGDDHAAVGKHDDESQVVGLLYDRSWLQANEKKTPLGHPRLAGVRFAQNLDQSPRIFEFDSWSGSAWVCD